MDEFEVLQTENEQSILQTANIQDKPQIMSDSMQHPLNRQQDMILDANHIQVEKNLQQLEVEKDLEHLTDAQREEAIEKAYEEHKNGTKLNALDKKGKRAKNMKKKAGYRKKAKSFKLPEPTNLHKLIAEAKPVDVETLIEEANILQAAFSNLKIKNDEAFSNNLESNFEVLAALDKLKANFAKAVRKNIIQSRGSFHSENVRRTIAMGEQVKKYMIAQQQLMQNPYYTMLAKKDVAGLSNEELVKKANAVEKANPTLAGYYRSVLAVRESGFERKKGMDVAYDNAAKQVAANKDDIDELVRIDKFEERAIKGEEARLEREKKAKDRDFQTKKKNFYKYYHPLYKKVEDSNREIENQDPEISEYKILSSYDVYEEIQKNPANDMNTDEYQQLYGHNFQYTHSRIDTAYIKTGNGALINLYIRDRKAGLEAKRKIYAKRIKDEKKLQKKLEEWEEGIKDTIALLKQNAKHDSIPQKCRLYRMCGDYVLQSLGLDPEAHKDDKQALVDQLNKMQGMTFKEKNFSSTGYRGDGDYFGVLKSPIMLTILCEKGQKCFITANQRETEIIFDKPEFEIVKAELADKNHPKKIPLSSRKLEHGEHGIDFSSEGTEHYQGGINLVVRLKRSDGDDPNA